MYSLMIVFATGLLMTLALTPFCRALAITLGIVDRPDNNRKIHRNPIPRIGGIPVAISFFASFAALLLITTRGGNAVSGNLVLLRKVAPAAVLIFIIGLLDDVAGLKPRNKLVGQIVAALLVFLGGVHFTGVGGYTFPIWLALPVTVVWLVACTNAFNLIDGLDGLAAGAGVFAASTVLVAALVQQNMPLAIATAPLAGALLGFLRYNFNPASVFLGDCGSLLIGFLLGCYGLLWNEKSTTVVGMTAPLIAFSIPLADTTLSIVRRFLRRRPIFGADRGHIHHRLLDRGLTPRTSALTIYVACGISAALSLVSVVQGQLAAPTLVAFCLAACVAVEKLGYAELAAARRIVFAGVFRHQLNAQLELTRFHDALKTSSTPEQCWQVLLNSYADFGFQAIRLKLFAHSYAHHVADCQIPNSWTVNIALSDTEYLSLSRGLSSSHSVAMAQFADTAAKVLRTKVDEVSFENLPEELTVLSPMKPLAFRAGAAAGMV